jgi:hypothetical protein
MASRSDLVPGSLGILRIAPAPDASARTAGFRISSTDGVTLRWSVSVPLHIAPRCGRSGDARPAARRAKVLEGEFVILRSGCRTWRRRVARPAERSWRAEQSGVQDSGRAVRHLPGGDVDPCQEAAGRRAAESRMMRHPLRTSPPITRVPVEDGRRAGFYLGNMSGACALLPHANVPEEVRVP